jgi:hypothetical protein
VLQNTGVCSGRFNWDRAAITHDHRLRTTYGVATGDLNLDGFEDVVTAASFRVTPGNNFLVGAVFGVGSFFDFVSLIERLWGIDGAAGELFFLDDTVHQYLPGDLTVEISSGNENNWVDVWTRGTFDLLSGGQANRDGIGAVVWFTPEGGETVIRPIMGGSSFLSQDSLAAHFGLGSATKGTVEVLWPGGVRNRVFDVTAGEHLVFPEIPCDLGSRAADPAGYRSCVNNALDSLVDAGVIDAADRGRFERGAFACDPRNGSLCLKDGRFQVDATWTGPSGLTKDALVRQVDDRAGILRFYPHGAVEMHVNLLDGCAINDHYWLFAAASTNVSYELTVTDTVSGEAKVYSNPSGEVAEAITDTSAFATCP